MWVRRHVKAGAPSEYDVFDDQWLQRSIRWLFPNDSRLAGFGGGVVYVARAATSSTCSGCSATSVIGSIGVEPRRTTLWMGAVASSNRPFFAYEKRYHHKANLPYRPTAGPID